MADNAKMSIERAKENTYLKPLDFFLQANELITGHRLCLRPTLELGLLCRYCLLELLDPLTLLLRRLLRHVTQLVVLKLQLFQL